MQYKSWVKLISFLFLFLKIAFLSAQTITEKIILEWSSPFTYSFSHENQFKVLYFREAITNDLYPTLPKFEKHYPVDNFYENYDIKTENLIFEPLSEEELSIVPQDFNQTSLTFEAKTMTASHHHFAVLSFIPIIKTSPGNYSKLISCDIILEGKQSKRKYQKERSFAANSVLQYGNWYKIAISNTGIHKVTYTDLVDLGVPVEQLSSSKITLFGNGGGMLAESNSVERFDDLTENPIYIHDGRDGIFNEGDYFLFYGKGPHSWQHQNGIFTHSYNIYSDLAYYFINVDEGIGESKRVNIVDNSSLSANQMTENYTFYDFIEKDEKNFGESGKKWYGDAFDIQTTRDYSFSLPGGATSTALITVCAAGVATQTSSMSIESNNTLMGTFHFNSIGDSYATESKQTFSFTPPMGTSTLPLTLTYSKPSVSSAAYLNYITLQAICKLQMSGTEMPFTHPESIGNGNITEFQIANANEQTRVWDVTHIDQIFEVKGTLSNNVLKIKSQTEELKNFVAFQGSSFKAVKVIGKVQNQNLHGTSDVNMIIVVHPNFISQAERLAQFRKENDGLTVKIVTPQQIYNEFSSGSQDVTAIRDYMRMIYKTSLHGNPKYLLLFGKPSYDYRERISGNKLYVPNYQSSESLNKNGFRSNDDYFGLLDDNEGIDCQGLVDVAIGRFPVTTVAQAQIAVEKTLNYSAKKNLLPPPAIGVSNFGDWRNVMTFVADDEDNYHILTTESAADFVEAKSDLINFDKIYLDSYQQVSNAGEQRYPEVNKAIENRMKKGSLVFLYVGHSGVKGWAHERILDFQAINAWDNKHNQPIMVTMGCEFGWYDRTTISPSELILFNPNGGAIGQISTSRVAFSLSNKAYSDHFFKNILKKENDQYLTLGELNKIAKNGAGGATNALNMIFTIGDPAMPLAFPTYTVQTDSINGKAITEELDTLKALSKVTIKGKVVDKEGSLLSDFNGNLYPSIFDKKTKIATLQNDPQSPYVEYYVQKNILFRGNATVKNGVFEFSFIVPQDINFEYGKGKISYYANSNDNDANGGFSEVIVGGQSDEIIDDKQGPEIQLFMNDENFVNGSITNQNPTLLVKLWDEHGINTTGNGIGHDLVAILDGKSDEQIVLNDYYLAEQDSFNCGTVRYPLKNLPLGKHTLKLRAWDILNNVSEKTLEFVVASDEELKLDHVLNYPNPFTTKTAFYFEHNAPEMVMNILIHIYTISGKIIKTIETTQLTSGNRSEPIYWDGRDDYGDKIGKGTYIYRLKVKTSNGKSAEKIEKLVIL